MAYSKYTNIVLVVNSLERGIPKDFRLKESALYEKGFRYDRQQTINHYSYML